MIEVEIEICKYNFLSIIIVMSSITFVCMMESLNHVAYTSSIPITLESKGSLICLYLNDV